MKSALILKMTIEIEPADACFMDAPDPAVRLGTIGMHTEMPDETLSGQDVETLMTLLRYTAANENVTADWVAAGVKKLMLVETFAAIQHVDFAKCIRALFELLGI